MRLFNSYLDFAIPLVYLFYKKKNLKKVKNQLFFIFDFYSTKNYIFKVKY